MQDESQRLTFTKPQSVDNRRRLRRGLFDRPMRLRRFSNCSGQCRSRELTASRGETRRSLYSLWIGVWNAGRCRERRLRRSKRIHWACGRGPKSDEAQGSIGSQVLDGLGRVVQLQGTIVVVMMRRLMQVQLGMRLLLGMFAQRPLLGDRDGLPGQNSQQKQGRKQAAHPSKYSQESHG